jgi:type IV pilus assembly protein PilE
MLPVVPNVPYSARSARTRGFTLIELMITVAIIAVLAAIAWPSYQKQVTRGRRSAAKSTMMDLATREQQYLLANRMYADTAALQANGYTLPSDVSPYYTWAVDLGDGSDPTPKFTITFTPTGAQTSDGLLTLDQAGNRTPLAKWQQ